MAPSSPPTVAASLSDPPSEQSVLIAARLTQTRRYVKFIDLCTGVATLLAGILAYLLIVALIDHWILDLSPILRLVSLLILLGGVAAFFLWRLLPPILYPVNPVYAAQTIEQAAPSLKNSLINLVLLSGNRAGVPSVIYEGLRREAAGQLAQVPPETMVDREPLIKAGYWLVALLALAAVYKVLSPKDPIQSAARIAAPWKAIDRPARVKIRNVQPGDADVYRGQTLEVTARIEGLDEEEAATLVYSTSDGQFIDQPIVLAPVGSGQFSGTLTMGPRGIQQSIVYRLQAGDTRTGEYQVTLKDAPHIDVRRVQYRYPAYTQRAERTAEGQGDLSAVEGTRVRIEAEANQPIDKAYLELFAGGSESDVVASQPSQAIPMRVDGQQATGNLTLLLQADRRTPQAAAYRIRFTTADGHRNEQPAHYQIEVTPDLEPDVEILQPRSRDAELPENGALTVEVRAFDPDYAVRHIRLVGAVGGAKRLNAELLDEPLSGQVIRKFRLVPREWGLSAGDVMIYWAEAEDNRQAANGTPAANVKRSANYRLSVTATDPSRPQDESDGDGADGAEGQAAGSKQGEGQEGGTGQNGSGGEGSKQEGSKQEGSEQEGSKQEGSEQEGSKQEGSKQEGSEESASEPSSSAGEGGEDGAESAPKEGEKGSSEDTSAGRDPGDGDAGSSELRPEGEGAESATEPGQSGDQTQPKGSDRSGSAQDSAGNSGTEAGESVADSENSPPEESADTGESPSSGAAGDPGSKDDATADDSQPVAPDGSDDAEAFERILRHMREKLGKDPADSAPSEQPRGEADPQRAPRDADAQADRPETTGDADVAPDGTPNSNSKEPSGQGKASPDTGAKPSDSARPQAERPDELAPSGQDSSTTDGRGAEAPKPAANATSADKAEQPKQGQPSPSEGESSEGTPPQNPRTDQPRDTPTGRPEAGSPDSSQGGSTTASGEATPTDSGSESGAAQADSDAEGQTRRAPSGSQPGEPQPDETTESTGGDSAEAANLEYAQRATDMALEHLKDQQQQETLRERLGWTEQEMQAFVRRWEQMRRDARQVGDRGQQSRRRLQDELRGLGLQPGAERVRQRTAVKDSLRQLRQEGSEVPIPAEYREQYRAFLKSVPAPADRGP